MKIYNDLRPEYCSKTGTSKKVTDAISKDSSTVKNLVNSLARISNSVCGNTFKYQIQCDRLVSILSDKNFDAAELQKFARATKWIFRDCFQDLHKDNNSYGGRIHAGSHADSQIGTAYRAYQLAKAIQHNDSSMLKTNEGQAIEDSKRATS